MVASGSGVVMFGCLVLAFMVVAAPNAEAAITCGMVATQMTPCVNYLQNGGPVPAACCNGVKTLYGAAKTTPDRQTTCSCMKSAATQVPTIKVGNAASLPGKCGITIPYKISPTTDCSKVK
ncbi:PREDICTED: non-specific lipid-transfer protein 1-like [Nelumbo nucifera]|uniref:Non-specific lipid-transfer protein n=2 Tax=Nelumbo nucifera TaxID=4432 RepID=A0A1U7ZT50_NELNU|nr:PREDICTED: non-specific lipid-transfer protein 1-like [Nelumbo nucifera]DAD38631.1 TPA_asm: hypothetical protein HUJ06_012953 [Nelumbo nucifera]